MTLLALDYDECEDAGFWNAADEDDLLTLQTNLAASQALAVILRAAEEVADLIKGDDYRDAILNFNGEFGEDAARLEATCKEQQEGISTTPNRYFVNADTYCRSQCERMESFRKQMAKVRLAAEVVRHQVRQVPGGEE